MKNCSWYISWVRKYISIVGEIWSKVSKGCTTNAQCKLKILFSLLTQRLPSSTNSTSDDPEQIMSKSKGMLVFGVQFLWEVIGSNFSTSESAMTPKLLHRGFIHQLTKILFGNSRWRQAWKIKIYWVVGLAVSCYKHSSAQNNGYWI